MWEEQTNTLIWEFFKFEVFFIPNQRSPWKCFIEKRLDQIEKDKFHSWQVSPDKYGQHGSLLSAFSLAKPQHSQDQTDANPRGFSEDYSQFAMNEWLDWA